MGQKAATASEMITALETERAGYVLRGLDDRVAQVDEQIEHYRALAEAEPVDDDGEADPAGDDDGASDVDDLDSLTVRELKDRIDAINAADGVTLSKSGNAQALIDRIREHVATTAHDDGEGDDDGQDD